MKNALFALLLLTIAGYKSNAQVTFTLVTAPCDSNGVLVANYSASSLPCVVHWLGGTGWAGGLITDPTSLLSDTLHNYNGGEVYVWVTASTGPVDTGTYAGAPPFTFTLSSTPVISGIGTASVSVVGGTLPYSYQWYTAPCPPPEPLASFVGTTNPISLPAGSYGISITDGTGCWTSSCADIGIYDTLKIATLVNDMQFEKNSSFTIYPNPATTSVTISSTGTITSVAICNLVGTMVFRQEYNTKQTQVDIADLPMGIYLIKVNNTAMSKFVKER